MVIDEEIKKLQTILPKCQSFQEKIVKKGDIITNYLLKRNQIGILLYGVADLIRYEPSGDKVIVERYRKNDIFGEVFHPITTNNELFVEAQEDSKVILFNYDDSPRFTTSKYQQLFTQTLLNLIFYKTLTQNTRIELLSRTSIREKLLFYFEYLESKNLQKTFEIKFSYTDLADYLNVNRSALMRELSHLEEDGFIERKGKKITIKY